MKHLGLFVVMLYMGMASFAQNGRMALQGECTSKWNGEKVYLYSQNYGDSCVVENGKFAFDLTPMKEPAEVSVFRINKTSGQRESVLVYLDDCATYLKLSDETYGHGTIFIKSEITGNPTTLAVKEVNDIFLGEVEPEDPKTDMINKLMDMAKCHDRAAVYAFWKYGAFMATQDGRLVAAMKDCLDNLPADLKSWTCTKELQAIYDEAAKKNNGGFAHDFTLNTPEGQPLSLYEYIKGKKLVLIDFWASWCGPCRAEGKNVKAIYDDYRDKGFDVLGVSLDSDLEAWKKAIKDDGMEWGQVSDLKGWKTPMAELYGFMGIPATYLVDGEGRIVAKNLRGEALRAKVAEICNK